MNKDIKFILKVVRNSFILSGIYLISVFAGGDLNTEVTKPVLIFFLMYIFTETGRYYKLNVTPYTKKTTQTMIFA